MMPEINLQQTKALHRAVMAKEPLDHISGATESPLQHGVVSDGMGPPENPGHT